MKVASSNIQVIGSDYASVSIVSVATSLFHVYYATKVGEKITRLDNSTIDFCATIDKKGLGKIGTATVQVLFGLIVGAAVEEKSYRIVFIKLKNGRRILIRINGSDYDYILKCRRKYSMRRMDEKDIRWSERQLSRAKITL